MNKDFSASTFIAQTNSASAEAAKYAALLGWCLFFVVPALFIAGLNDAIIGGPADDSNITFSIMLTFAAISFAAAIVGAVWGRQNTRVFCVILLALQVLPILPRIMYWL